VAVMVAVSAAALALAGYLPSGGYERGGYEYSALFGNVPIGGYDLEGYQFS
jgi:hypothetical protein